MSQRYGLPYGPGYMDHPAKLLETFAIIDNAIVEFTDKKEKT